jgi:hypothetical protein
MSDPRADIVELAQRLIYSTLEDHRAAGCDMDDYGCTNLVTQSCKLERQTLESLHEAYRRLNEEKCASKPNRDDPDNKAYICGLMIGRAWGSRDPLEQLMLYRAAAWLLPETEVTRYSPEELHAHADKAREQLK